MEIRRKYHKTKDSKLALLQAHRKLRLTLRAIICKKLGVRFNHKGVIPRFYGHFTFDCAHCGKHLTVTGVSARGRQQQLEKNPQAKQYCNTCVGYGNTKPVNETSSEVTCPNCQKRFLLLNWKIRQRVKTTEKKGFKTYGHFCSQICSWNYFTKKNLPERKWGQAGKPSRNRKFYQHTCQNCHDNFQANAHKHSNIKKHKYQFCSPTCRKHFGSPWAIKPRSLLQSLQESGILKRQKFIFIPFEFDCATCKKHVVCTKHQTYSYSRESQEEGRKDFYCLNPCRRPRTQELKARMRAKTKRGINHPQFTGGTKVQDFFRRCNLYRKWKRLVRQFNPPFCVDCGTPQPVNGVLEVDHIKSVFSIFEEFHIKKYLQIFENPECERQLFDIKNGQLLCHTCHEKKTREEFTDEWFKERAFYIYYPNVNQKQLVLF